MSPNSSWRISRSRREIDALTPVVSPRREGMAFGRAAFFGFSTLGRDVSTDPDVVPLVGVILGWADSAFFFRVASEAGAPALAFPACFRFATIRSPMPRTSTVGRVKGNSLSWRTARLYNRPGPSLADFGPVKCAESGDTTCWLSRQLSYVN